LAYRAIAEEFGIIVPGNNINDLNRIIKNIYLQQGREKLFDKFLDTIGLDRSYLPRCLEILRSFELEKPMDPDKKVINILQSLVSMEKALYVLTNGNADQQRNKIKHIAWQGLDKSIRFIFADEIKPKPSPAGVEYIFRISGKSKNETIMIGDSETDFDCAENSGIAFLNVKSLKNI
jgi:HAD superfamily hydrolase (TIGR01549 family)